MYVCQMFVLLVQFRDALFTSLVTPVFRYSCLDKGNSLEMGAAMSCCNSKFICALLNRGHLDGKPQVFITINSLHLFSLAAYIKFMPSKHSFFRILVGHIWGKTCKRVSGTNHCVRCWAFLGEICLSALQTL